VPEPHGFAVRGIRHHQTLRCGIARVHRSVGDSETSAVRLRAGPSLTALRRAAVRFRFAPDAAASTASHAAFVTIATRPSCRVGTARLIGLICSSDTAERARFSSRPRAGRDRNLFAAKILGEGTLRESISHCVCGSSPALQHSRKELRSFRSPRRTRRWILTISVAQSPHLNEIAQSKPRLGASCLPSALIGFGR
jgi:hypothetical protein